MLNLGTQVGRRFWSVGRGGGDAMSSVEGPGEDLKAGVGQEQVAGQRVA